jgi:hypothetical protein
VFTTQSRISDLEHTVKLADERFSNYIKQPGREKMEVELLKKDLSYLQTQIEELKHRGK